MPVKQGDKKVQDKAELLNRCMALLWRLSKYYEDERNGTNKLRKPLVIEEGAQVQQVTQGKVFKALRLDKGNRQVYKPTVM